MTQDPYEPYEEDEANPPRRRRSRRDGFAIDLTGMGVRVAATILVIVLGVVIIYFALRPSGDSGELAFPPTEEETQSGDLNEPLATFTPGPTSTPPPPDEPTAASTEPEVPPGELGVGAEATVTGTGEVGLNMRADSSTSGEIIQILSEGTTVTITEGPVEADDFTWWKVQAEDGNEGWVVEAYLSP